MFIIEEANVLCDQIDNNIESAKSEEILLSSSSDNICRICLDMGPEPLLAPCLCSGTGKFVHDSCLKKWINQKYPQKTNAICEVCRKEFNMKLVIKCKCDIKYAFKNKFAYFCSIPILFLIVFSMLAISAVGTYNMIRKGEYQSILPLTVICIILSLFSVILLINAALKALVHRVVKNWIILPYENSV